MTFNVKFKTRAGLRIRIWFLSDQDPVFNTLSDPDPVLKILSDPDPDFKIWSDSDPTLV